MKTTLQIAGAWLVIYLLLAFYSASLDITLWVEGARFTFLLFGGASALIISVENNMKHS